MTFQTYHRRNDDNRYHCVFCGSLVADMTEQDDTRERCPHLLYLAHSEGFVFVSKRFIAHVVSKGMRHDPSDGLFPISGENEDGDDLVLCEILDQEDIPDHLQIVDEVGPPSLEQFYIGLAPLQGSESPS